MKVVHLVYGMSHGGIETMLVNIMNEQCKSIQVVLIIPNEEIEATVIEKIDKKVKIIKIGRPIGSKNPWYLLKLNMILWEMKPDVIHVHHPGLIRFIMRRLFRNRICFTLHNAPMDSIIKYLKYFKHIVAISESVKNDLQQKTDIESTVIINGINVDEFSCSNKLRKDDTGVFKIIQCGRLVHRIKGQDITIRGASILKKKGVLPFQIDIVGDGPSREYLQALIISEQVSDCVRLLGAQSQDYLRKNLCTYDLLVQPSRYEGFGLTVVEALASKVNVLVSEQEGPLEIIKNSKCGLAFKPNDVSDFTEKLEYLIRSAPDKLQLDAAHNYVRKNYDVKQTAMNYIQFYKQYFLKNI
ncbi:MAG: glycosyltransferase family 4 protein [Candidatus Symbiothrix sp.]|jgi:glycosyltransferase involved in cell wall biosynthesis|nr:glycosyltransferase family 4 protein [Candidatus Symbiothrix sp.]